MTDGRARVAASLSPHGGTNRAARVIESSQKHGTRELFQLFSAGGYDHGSEIRTAATTPRASKALVW